MRDEGHREAACVDPSCPQLSAYVGDTVLGLCFGRGLGCAGN